MTSSCCFMTSSVITPSPVWQVNPGLSLRHITVTVENIHELEEFVQLRIF